MPRFNVAPLILFAFFHYNSGLFCDSTPQGDAAWCCQLQRRS
ncbi:hypothetical protein V462_22605 [Pantoea ananatis 15320]|nr:hypothetical protein V462_22605 [Pantoea ananatis 15320]PKC40906.1 hypothetical protein V461_21390 [Pantoea ananatis BRT98]